MVIRSNTPIFGTPRHDRVQELKKLCKENDMIFSLYYPDPFLKLPIISIVCRKCRSLVKVVMWPHLKDEFVYAKERISSHDCVKAARLERRERYNYVRARKFDFDDLL